jgi:hypothetical protein
MAVPVEMRQVEDEIDQAIRRLPIWKYSRSVLLRRILSHYRYGTQFLMERYSRALIERDSKEMLFLETCGTEITFGLFQAFKWAMEFANERRKSTAPPDKALNRLIELGCSYRMVVDFLKCANHDLVGIEVDQQERTVRIYEGGDLTGADHQLVSYQLKHLRNYRHVDLTEDSDQLTRSWNAGEFRRLIRHLSDFAQEQSHTVGYDSNGVKIDLFKRPTLIEVPDLHDSVMNAVIEDLTLSPEKIQELRYQPVTFMEMPLVKIGKRRFGVSDILITLGDFACDDYMLRVACRVDRDQYSKVSGLREDRMIAFCKDEFEAKGWKVEPHKKIRRQPKKEIEKEIDILARRETETVVLQLKSTLRPEAPWEVYKRNEDILKGVEHTGQVLQLLQKNALGFVITDGYRGDYVTWASALRASIPIGTLRDVSDIAQDPVNTIELLKQRVGFDQSRKPEPMEDREFNMMGWRIKVIDSPSPPPK